MKKNNMKSKKHLNKYLIIRNIEFGKDYMIIKWECKNIGFGECTFGINKKVKIIDDESMGTEFVRILCSKMADFYPLLNHNNLPIASTKDKKRIVKAIKNKKVSWDRE
jgi:hypothetical protein